MQSTLLENREQVVAAVLERTRQARMDADETLDEGSRLLHMLDAKEQVR